MMNALRGGEDGDDGGRCRGHKAIDGDSDDCGTRDGVDPTNLCLLFRIGDERLLLAKVQTQQLKKRLNVGKCALTLIGCY